MPRKRKPGPRQNRTDLTPVAAPAPGGPAQGQRQFTGRPYGERAASIALQNVAPMPDRSAEAMMSGAGGVASPSPAPATAEDPLSQFLAAAQSAESPGEGLMSAPSARPGEPVTAGLETGMGGGPDALPPLATTGTDPSVVLWAKMLPGLGVLASQPGSSPEVRQLYRRLRSQLPPDYYSTTET